jgi:hypothetical protein
MTQNIKYIVGEEPVWVSVIPDGSMWLVKSGQYTRINQCPYTGTPAPKPMRAKNTGNGVEWVAE